MLAFVYWLRVYPYTVLISVIRVNVWSMCIRTLVVSGLGTRLGLYLYISYRATNLIRNYNMFIEPPQKMTARHSVVHNFDAYEICCTLCMMGYGQSTETKCTTLDLVWQLLLWVYIYSQLTTNILQSHVHYIYQGAAMGVDSMGVDSMAVNSRAPTYFILLSVLLVSTAVPTAEHSFTAGLWRCKESLEVLVLSWHPVIIMQYCVIHLPMVLTNNTLGFRNVMGLSWISQSATDLCILTCSNTLNHYVKFINQPLPNVHQVDFYGKLL